jgi:hypothetical protein
VHRDERDDRESDEERGGPGRQDHHDAPHPAIV